jgi:predicted TIM-barrel fold metal-dependent hydrolase
MNFRHSGELVEKITAMNVVDTHVHVFVRGLKLAAIRRYVPDYDATIEDYLARMDRFGITHAVMVQPSFLGTDNSFMCEVLREHRQRLRGIAVVEPDVSEAELDALQRDGVVGIRLNLDSLPIPEFDRGPWPKLLASLIARDWQIEVHREARDLALVIDPLVEAGVRVVVDHFGRIDDDLGADDPGFKHLLSKASSRRVWVKLSGAYRNGSEGRGFAHAPAAARQLLDHFGADRLVWGSDWPHTRHESYIDIPRMRRELDAWVTDPADREGVLGTTALELFKF